MIATILVCFLAVQPISVARVVPVTSNWQDDFFPGFNPLPIPAYADRPSFIPNQPLPEHQEELVKKA